MTSNSRTALVEHDSTVYATSETSEEIGTWIQLAISHQTYDAAGTALIEGIYVQTVTQEVIPVTEHDTSSEIESQLAAMAADPDMQREIRLIEEEFAGTELDGLTD